MNSKEGSKKSKHYFSNSPLSLLKSFMLSDLSYLYIFFNKMFFLDSGGAVVWETWIRHEQWCEERHCFEDHHEQVLSESHWHVVAKLKIACSIFCYERTWSIMDMHRILPLYEVAISWLLIKLKSFCVLFHRCFPSSLKH